MKYLICSFFLCITCLSFAQDYGGLRGTLMEDFTHTPIQYARLSLRLDNGALVAQTRADADGSFLFANIEVGSYNLIISKLGLSPLKITNIFIPPNKFSELNPMVEAQGFDQDTLVFTYSELQQKSPNENDQIVKGYCTKRQLRALRKLEKEVIH